MTTYLLFIKLLWFLVAAHLICDYKLQGSEMSRAKNFNTPPAERTIPWWVAMTAHVIIHGAAVLLITNLIWLALAEAGSHFYIDCAKNKGFISFKTDQIIHVALKVIWAALTVWGLS